MNRRSVLAFIGISLMALCAPAGARAQAKDASGDKKAAAASSSSAAAAEVAVDMVVRDKHGRPIRDLKPEEIQVTDGGEVVAVRSVSQVSDATREKRAPHAIVLVFDSMNGEPARFSREGAMDLVKGADEADAVVSVVCIASRLGVLEPFTNDHDALKKAIETATVAGPRRSEEVARVEEGLRKLPAASGAPNQIPAPRVLLDAVAEAERASRDQRAQAVMASLIGLTRSLSKLPGRKAIVYFSDGMRLSTSEVTLFQGLISQANSSGVSVYGVDASETGVEASSQAMLAVSAVSGNMRANGIGVAGPAPRTHDAGNVQAYSDPAGHQFGSADEAMPTGVQDTLRELAVSTGGQFVPAEADMKKQMRWILDDETSYYEMIYKLKAEPQPGQFRKIAIATTRPGLRVQTANGYLAGTSSTAQFSVFEALLEKAIRERSGGGGPEMLVRAFTVHPGAKTVTGEVVAVVPLAGLQVQEVSSEKVARVHFSILALIRDAAGHEVARCSEDVPWRIAIESKEAKLAGVYTFSRSFTAPPGKYTVDVAVLDRFADKTAFGHTAFESPAVNGMAMSDPIFALKLEAAPPEPDLSDPLLYGAKRVVPDLHSPITSAEDGTLPLFLILYPDPAAREKPTLEVRILGAHVSSKPSKLPLKQVEGKPDIPFVVDIPAKNLRPGKYTVRATLVQGGARTEREAQFVVPGETPAEAAASAAAPEENDALAPPPLLQQMAPPRADAVEKPSEADQASLIAGGRDRALAYTNSLPNFTCIETTHRSTLKGGHEWKPLDTISEVVRYIDKHEDRHLLEVNGVPTTGDRSSLSGTFFSGEFGPLLRVLLGEKAQAKYEWKETTFLDGVRCEVFSAKVERVNSAYRLSLKTGWSIVVSYVGTVYIDASTFNIRRVTLEAVDIPKEFPVRASSLLVDYGYARVGDADYLLPMSGAVEQQEGRRARVRIEVHFRDYHRMGSETTIRYSAN